MSTQSRVKCTKKSKMSRFMPLAQRELDIMENSQRIYVIIPRTVGGFINVDTLVPMFHLPKEMRPS